MALIAAVNVFETQAGRDQTWGDAVLVTEGPPPDTAAGRVIPVSVWRLPTAPSFGADDLLVQLGAAPEGQELISLLGLDETERVLLVTAPLDVLAQLLESGRVPEPGKHEALAGDMAQRDSFDLYGESFRVVGRIARGVAALRFAYVIPDNGSRLPVFAAYELETEGWLDPEGQAWLESEDPDVSANITGNIIAGPARMEPAMALAVILGLILIAFGGSWIQIGLIRRAALRRKGVFAPVLAEAATHPLLLGAVHAALYGVFFALMLTATSFPRINFNLSHAVQDMFLEGDLSYIGSAYASGDILAATAATFYHNYFFATLLLTILPSLIIPFAGLIKNLVSFAVVGFVMSPIWEGSAHQLVFHSITMVLEFEAYMIATFAIILFPIRLIGAFRASDPRAAIQHAFGIMASAALLSGIVLVIAALYEATSLILLS